MRLTTVLFAAVLALFGGTSAFAATPDDCAESDDVPPEVECPEDGDNYPLVLPDEGTVPAPTTTAVAAETPPPTVPQGGLPRTGSDSSTGLLQIGGLLLATGLLVFVVARRRSPAPA